VVAEIEKTLVEHRNSRLGRGGHWTIGGETKTTKAPINQFGSFEPTSPVEIQNYLQKPDDWKWITMNHRTQSGNLSLSAAKFWTHRYTAMTRGPCYLANIRFELRQKVGSFPRETMLLIGVHYPSVFDEAEFNARFATTLDSVIEALVATPGLCGTPSSRVPWWTTIVVCLIHNGTTEAQYVFSRNGLGVRCDTESEHCGMAPEDIRDEG
jgi:hypothetical protein